MPIVIGVVAWCVLGVLLAAGFSHMRRTQKKRATNERPCIEYLNHAGKPVQRDTLHSEVEEN